MNTIKNWFLKRGLRKQKERALYEVEFDIKYIEVFKSDILKLDETPLRKRMTELKKKESLTEQEEIENYKLLAKINESKAVKNEYEKSKELAADLRNYLSII